MRRVGIVCPKCGMHPMRTIKTCEDVKRDLIALGPDWRAAVERSTKGLLNPTEVTMDDLARGYALVPE